MRMRVRYLDCLEAGLCCYLVRHIETYYVRYSCSTSVCDLFTDSASHSSCAYWLPLAMPEPGFLFRDCSGYLSLLR
jgi:hypothetical protein